MNRNLIVSLLIGTAVSAVMFYLAFRNVPFTQLVSYLGSVNYWWVVPATATIVASFLLRVLRWRIILRSAHSVSFADAHHPVMIGFMMNCVLPGRVGELARPIILAKRNRVPFTTGLATVAAERVFDLAVLIALLAVVLASVHIDPDLSMTFGNYELNRETLEAIAGGTFKLCLVFIVGIGLVSVDAARRWIHRVILSAPRLFWFASESARRKLTERIAMPLVSMIDNMASGFSLVRYPRTIVLIIGLTIVVWTLQAFSYQLVAFGCPGIDLSYLELMAVMIIICFFIALPSVPGFWGLWEAGGVFALALFGIPASESAGFTLANHAVQMFPVILIGIGSAIVTGINILKVTGRGSEDGGQAADMRGQRTRNGSIG